MIRMESEYSELKVGDEVRIDELVERQYRRGKPHPDYSAIYIVANIDMDRALVTADDLHYWWVSCESLITI